LKHFKIKKLHTIKIYLVTDSWGLKYLIKYKRTCMTSIGKSRTTWRTWK
jgi:hypothetical protein